MSIEDVLKIVSVVLIPSIGAVVWLLREVYGLRGDLRELQSEARTQAARIGQLERSIERLANSVTELTMILARSGIEAEKGKQHG